MNEAIKLTLGILVLFLGFPIGRFLQKITKEETKDIQIWMKGISYIGLGLGSVSLILGNDALMFTFFFVSIVCSQNILKKKR